MSSRPDPGDPADEALVRSLRDALGAEAVATDPAERDFFARDVFGRGGAPLCVIRPADAESVRAAVRLCAAARVPMVVRGGGASYVDGFLHRDGDHVLFDLRGLDTISIDATNQVATVGAGTTWAALAAKLAGTGLRTPFRGPFSGIAATVGGSVSHHTVSHGSGTHGISAQSVLSLDVVLASGELLTTSPSAATRFDGPDLTGLFTGDCGALGIKVAVRLPLVAERRDFEALSFAFDDFARFHDAMRALSREALDDLHFGVDRALSEGQIGKQEGAASKVAIAREIVRSAPTLRSGLMRLASMARAGTGALRAGAFMLHAIVEGVDPGDAGRRSRRLRGALSAAGGREIAASVPAFVRAVPFAPLTNIVGPRGERWVAFNGILSHDAVVAFHAAFTALLAQRAEAHAARGIRVGTMFMNVGPAGFLYEVAIYWPDALTPYHHRVLDAGFVASLEARPAAAGSSEAVRELRRDVVALMDLHGAAHFQLGRVYPYLSRLSPRARATIESLKATLDPAGLMNPGVLGL